MRPSPVGGTIEGSTPYATLREPCFGFGVYIRTFSETAEIDCESLPHENLAEIGCVANTRCLPRARDRFGRIVATCMGTFHWPDAIQAQKGTQTTTSLLRVRHRGWAPAERNSTRLRNGCWALVERPALVKAACKSKPLSRHLLRRGRRASTGGVGSAFHHGCSVATAFPLTRV